MQCRARSHGTSDVLRGHQAAGCEAGLKDGPAAEPRHKGGACLREAQAKKKKKHFQEGRIKTDGGNKRNKKLYLKKKKVENLTIASVTAGLGGACGQAAGVGPAEQLEGLGRRSGGSFGLIWSVFLSER